jgi:hypothetical protein
MNESREEKEIRELLAPVKLRKPPAALLKDYEREVFEKIRAAEAAPGFPWGLAAAAAICAVAAGALILWLMAQPASKPATQPQGPSVQAESENSQQAVPPKAGPVAHEPELTVDEEEIARELLLLEMLEEDEGLIEDLDTLEADTELWLKTQPVAASYSP